MNKHAELQWIETAARFLKVVGHPLRLALVEKLEKGRARVGDLVDGLNVSQAEVSKQLALLRRAGVVRSTAKGNERWYTVADPRVRYILDCIQKHSKGKSS
ncbi:MAG: winged helix-turn-helix transcriptional regulator [Candidatus Omnitrophica bacterium]|jgi:DNA-binding transcriptional ArsR family regulator|nr:winged helix-turn-helix transcriptional regulator [Candidatus Omnitrophota bacterium]